MTTSTLRGKTIPNVDEEWVSSSENKVKLASKKKKSLFRISRELSRKRKKKTSSEVEYIAKRPDLNRSDPA